MALKNPENLFTDEILQDILPPQLADDFFEALYGDAAEGAYDLSLAFVGYDPDRKKLAFEIRLDERPGKCLACNLTYGLPEVLARHPLINMKGLVDKIVARLGNHGGCVDWELGRTRADAANVHAIPLSIQIDN